MTPTEILAVAVRAMLAGVFVLAAVDYIRHRERTRGEIALMLGSLGIPVLVQFLPGDWKSIRWVSTISSLAIVAQPYLILRLVDYLRPVPRVARWTALALMGGSWIVVAVYPAPLPTLATLLVIAYFVLVEGYAAVALLWGALTTAGVSRWRFSFAGAGSAVLTVVIFLAGVRTAAPGTSAALAFVVAALPVFAAAAYYLGFVPPGWLRRTWQLPQLYHFLQTIGHEQAASRSVRTTEELCRSASHITGGLASTVFLWDQDEGQLKVAAADHPGLADASVGPDEGVIGRSWRRREPGLFEPNPDVAPGEAGLAARLGASRCLVVPISSEERPWGVLAVFLRREPLFASDDLEMLGLLAAQCAMVLDNANLVEQQRRVVGQLEVANKELEAFTYSVSHDLRSPLRAIDGYSQALVEDYGDKIEPQAHEYIKRVRAAAGFMGELIDGLLRLSRVTRTELRRSPVDLSSLARKILDRLAKAEPGRDVKVVVADGLTATGDPMLLEVVLENLLANAWKFTSKKPVATIEFGKQSENGTVTYYVRDDGAGFDMTYTDKLFGAFQRLHGREEFDGTGIGLATVQRIVHRHGGQIRAEAAVGRGATFYFTL